MTGTDQRLDNLYVGLQSVCEGTMTLSQQISTEIKLFFSLRFVLACKDRMLIFMNEKNYLKVES